MKAKEIAAGIIVGDYRAERDGPLLQFLDALSDQRKDGGIFHGGHIHYIQNKLSDEDDFCFLKAAISSILDVVPSVFPLDLPELVEGGTSKAPTREQGDAIHKINAGLLLPIGPFDVVRVIKAAREYIALDEGARA